MTVRIKPECFEDLIAVLALYRPGPLDSGMAEQYIKRKNGKEPIRMLHPLLQPILEETYGVIVYQEQVMQIAQRLARYTLGEADILRRAMGKKDPDEMASQRERFIHGSSKNGISVKKAGEIFDQMETFARYGFNKSHSAAYALISYQTAYMKAHYPVEFMAALMTSEMDDTDKVIKNLAECRQREIKVLPPDINESSVNFTPVGRSIRFGLVAVRNVGTKAVEAIKHSREKQGRFTSLYDFCRRIDSTLVNKRVIESLIKCGAFDSTSAHRSQMMASLDDALRTGQLYQKQAGSAQMNMFASLDQEEKQTQHGRNPQLPDLHEWPQNQLLAFEKEALGFYITGHPLDKYETELGQIAKEDTHSLKAKQQNEEVEIGGVVTALKLRNTKKGERYAQFQLEDRAGFVDAIVWPDVYKRFHENLVRDDPIWVRGKLEVGEERVQLIATEIVPLEASVKDPGREVTLTLDTARVSKEQLPTLRDTLLRHHGSSPTTLSILVPESGEILVDLPDQLRVSPTERMAKEIQGILGYPAVTIR
jgi:DNA polymerase-3 subunit alpha